jgi:uncharacterized protein (TIGR02466 family)
MINDDEYNVLPLFSKVFYIKTLNYINDSEIKDILKNCKLQKYSITQKNNFNCSKTSLDTKILDSNSFKKLKQIIYTEFNFFKNNILKYTNTDFKITTSWITKTEKNNFSLIHNHQNSMFSGVFYVDINENQDNISFENVYKPSFFVEPNEYNIYNSCEQKIIVKNKTLIIFPSEVHHNILKNEMKKDRYSIAFNIIPNGKFGIKNTDGEIYINVL